MMRSREVFPEPEAFLTETPKLLGLDGRREEKQDGKNDETHWWGLLYGVLYWVEGRTT